MHKDSQQTICVVGLGYIGLPTAAIFASRGMQVIGVDTNPKVLEAIADGSFHYVEPDLDMLVQASVSSGNLKIQASPQKADVFLIAVPTPVSHDHEVDLSCLDSAIVSVAPFLQKGNLIIIESTVPVGTTEKLSALLATLRQDLQFPHKRAQEQQQKFDIHIAFCPERVLPGQMLKELVGNDRVIGGITKACAEIAQSCYAIFVRGQIKLTDARTAEMCKLAENAFRDVNIAFANELSMVAAKHDIRINELIELANCHPRVNILQPGCGVGGHCIAVDPWFLINTAPQESHLMRAARQVNTDKAQWVLSKAMQATEQIRKIRREESQQKNQQPTEQDIQQIQVACLGITYKADVDDLRESPALEIVEQLAKDTNLQISVVEPNIQALPRSLEKKNISLKPLKEALDQSDLVLVLVDHAEFKNHNYKSVGTQALIDTQGIWN